MPTEHKNTTRGRENHILQNQGALGQAVQLIAKHPGLLHALATPFRFFPGNVYISDKEGNVIFANEGCYEMFGFKSEKEFQKAINSKGGLSSLYSDPNSREEWLAQHKVQNGRVVISEHQIGFDLEHIITVKDQSKAIGAGIFLGQLENRSLEAQQKEELKKAAVTDELTKLPNRKGFDEALRIEIERAARYHKPLSLLMIDLDHFKQVNDEYGHPVGDKVLVEIANVIKTVIRVLDIPARWGGEEFMVILPETNWEGAVLAAKKIGRQIEEYEILINNGKILQKTVSIGVADWDQKLTLEELERRVDVALYQAKNLGRNTVSLYKEL